MQPFSFSKPMRQLRAVLAFGLCILLTGCAASPTPATKAPILKEYKQVAILPFANAAALYGEGQQVRNPLTAKAFTTGVVPESASAVLSEALWAQLRAKSTTRFIPPGQSAGEWAELIAEASASSERRLVAELGRRQGADGVLLGTLYRFRERVGLKYSAESPAALTFDLLLLDTTSTRVVWSRSFDEVQRPLSENLLKILTFFKDKGRWLTAAQMGDRALDEMTTALTRP